MITWAIRLDDPPGTRFADDMREVCTLGQSEGVRIEASRGASVRRGVGLTRRSDAMELKYGAPA